MEEWWLVCLTVPVILAFIPGCDHQVARGFAALRLAPTWFQESVGAAILFAFGRRTFSGLRLPSFQPRKERTHPAAATLPPAQGAGT